MKIIEGKYNSAVVYTEIIEQNAIEQIRLLCDQEFIKGSKIRIMPDVHSGAGCTIGTTITIDKKVVPNMVGVDIGCGMEVVKLKDKNIELSQFDKLIYEKIPSGFNIRDKAHKFNDEVDLETLKCKKTINVDKERKSMGSLGGGNHFIEVNRDTNNQLYIVVHSGSRHLGVSVAKYYQDEAWKLLNKNSDEDVANLIKQYKKAGRDKEIQTALKSLKEQIGTDVPKHLAYTEGSLFEDYIHDMAIVQHFAQLNRKAIIHELVKGMKLHVSEQFTTIHNYIDTENMILRKGAVSAKAGEILLIPINMRDGSILCRGKGNPEWNYSAPHGAGRLMSRTEAKNQFTLSEFKKVMKDIYTTSVNKETLDECPMAYKTMEDIVNNINDTVEIIDIIRPIYNFKAGE